MWHVWHSQEKNILGLWQVEVFFIFFCLPGVSPVVMGVSQIWSLHRSSRGTWPLPLFSLIVGCSIWQLCISRNVQVWLGSRSESAGKNVMTEEWGWAVAGFKVSMKDNHIVLAVDICHHVPDMVSKLDWNYPKVGCDQRSCKLLDLNRNQIKAACCGSWDPGGVEDLPQLLHQLFRLVLVSLWHLKCGLLQMFVSSFQLEFA